MVKLSQPELGREIKKRRQELEWTQSELAEKAGTTQAHIAKIESGEYNPKGETVQRIYDAMGLQFVIKDAAYEINARLEMLGQEVIRILKLIAKKMRIPVEPSDSAED